MAGSQHGSTSGAVPGLADPVSGVWAHLLRRAVLDHIASEHRRVFAPVVRVGLPGGAATALRLDGHLLDHALRTDVLEAMLDRMSRSRSTQVDPAVPRDPNPLVWLTRRGTLEVQDLDLAWSSAAGTAAAELGQQLTMVVVTRQGWRDPRTGTFRSWQRLRPPRP